MAKESAYFTLDGADSKQDAKAIKRELDKLPGVFSVTVSGGAGQVAVDFDSTGVHSGRIRERLEKMGYTVLESRTEEHLM